MNKKILVSLLFVLLGGWVTASCYWYIEKVRKNPNTELTTTNSDEGSNSEELNAGQEKLTIEKPLFSIKNGDAVISESNTNISFADGTAEMEVPKEMEAALNELVTFMKNNPESDLKITGLQATTETNDSLAVARAQSVASYFEKNKGIETERLSTASVTTDNIYKDETSQRIIGGVQYEIITKPSAEPVLAEKKAEVAEKSTEVKSTKKVSSRLLKKVKQRRIMYYPLTHFEIQPTLKLEKYFKNLKKYFDQNPNGMVQITGHIDDEGNPGKSRYTSKKYARKVKAYLVSKYKMNPRNFRVKGRGNARPVADSNTDIGRAENRRIEFKFIK